EDDGIVVQRPFRLEPRGDLYAHAAEHPIMGIAHRNPALRRPSAHRGGDGIALRRHPQLAHRHAVEHGQQAAGMVGVRMREHDDVEAADPELGQRRDDVACAGIELSGQRRSPPASINIEAPPGNWTTAESPWPTARKVMVIPFRAEASAARVPATKASSAQGTSANRKLLRVQSATPPYQRRHASNPGAAMTMVANGREAK